MTDDKTRAPGDAPRELDARAMKAFSHPLRMAMYAYLTDHGSATATSLARALNESTGQTSYHLRQLEKHGLVEEDAGRGTGRERWWRSVGFRLHAEDFARDEATRGPLNAIMGAQLHRKMEVLRRWYADFEEDGSDWINASVENTGTFDLTVEQTAALGEELMIVIDRHREAARRANEGTAEESIRRVRLYLSLFPLPLGDDTTE